MRALRPGGGTKIFPMSPSGSSPDTTLTPPAATFSAVGKRFM
jgi:hypothetical protein